MTIIELPDEQAAVLNAKAAALGLSKGWLETLAMEAPAATALKPFKTGKLAEREADTSLTSAVDAHPEWANPPRSPQEAAARIREIRKHTRPDPDGLTVKDYIDYGRP